jgi:prepilin-type N-terminal cleavage/methylation domain-containing protein
MMTPQCLPTMSARAFTLLEAMVALSIAGIVAVTAASVFTPLTRSMKLSERQSQLNAAAHLIDDHLRMLLRNLGGGALDPGHLVYVHSSADVYGDVKADRLIISRALANGVMANAATPPEGGASITLNFTRVTAEGGGVQCPLTSVPSDAGVMNYAEALTFYGVDTPVLLLSGDRAAAYVVTSALNIVGGAPTSPTFQDCSLTVGLDSMFNQEPLAAAGPVAIFPARRELVYLDGPSLPAELVLHTITPIQSLVGAPVELNTTRAVMWHRAFDFQIHLGLDAAPRDGVISDGEWALDGSEGCAAWPSCLSTLVSGARPVDLRMARFGAVIGNLAPNPGSAGAVARVLDSVLIERDDHVLRAVSGQTTFRNSRLRQ